MGASLLASCANPLLRSRRKALDSEIGSVSLCVRCHGPYRPDCRPVRASGFFPSGFFLHLFSLYTHKFNNRLYRYMIYIHTYIYIYTYTYVCSIYIYMYKYIHLISFVRVCLCVFVCVCVCVCLHMCMFMHVPGSSLGWAEPAHDNALCAQLLLPLL